MSGLKQAIRRSVTFTQPTYEPVSLADAKRWCNVDDDITNEDSIVRMVVVAARMRAEFLTGAVFIQRDAVLSMDDLPCDGSAIAVPLAPLQSVSYIRYLDTSGAQQTLSGSPDAFLVDTSSKPGRISPLYGASWPSTNRTIGNVRIGFRCGYAPGGSPDSDEAAYQYNVPAPIKVWMQQRVATYYQNREALDFQARNVAAMPRDFVDSLLDQYRVDFGSA